MIERIKKLEQSNRRMKKYMISLHIILVGMLVVGFQSTAIPDVIEARKLVIKDDKGEDKIILSSNEGKSTVQLKGIDGNYIKLSASENNFVSMKNKQSFILLENYDWKSGIDLSAISASGNHRYLLSTDKGLYAHDLGRYYFEMGVTNGFVMDLRGKSKRIYSLRHNSSGTNLSMFDPKGKGNSIYLFDENGNKRVSIGNQNMIDQYGNEYKSAVSSIHLFNQNNKTIFAAPN